MKDISKIFIISAPSGAGKTTLNRSLINKYKDVLELSISHTTRAKRLGEIHGKDYYFITQEEFENMITKNEMLEWAKVHGNFYGTNINELYRIVNKNKIPILEIDVQGWEQVRVKIPQAISIFILPPSIESLWERLINRKTDSYESCINRLKNARREINNSKNYNYFIINDNFDKALMELENIIIKGEKGKIPQDIGISLCTKLDHEFENNPKIKKINI